MIEYPSRLDGVFHALSDPTRRAMLAALAPGERSEGELAAPSEMSLAAASKHIRPLERAGLLRRTEQGHTHRCALQAAPQAEAEAWLQGFAKFSTARLNSLEALLRGAGHDGSGNPPDAPPTRGGPTP